MEDEDEEGVGDTCDREPTLVRYQWSMSVKGRESRMDRCI